MPALPPVDPWSLIAGALTVFVSATAAGHAVLTKREVRAAIGWTGLIAVVPLIGAILYLIFGINRIQRRAAALGVARPAPRHGAPDVFERLRNSRRGYLIELARYVERTVPTPLLDGNSVAPRPGGGEVYDEMLAAIDGAERSIALVTYIFSNDRTGRRFRDALRAAVQRGVEVRVLIDAVGDRYSWPSMIRSLRRRGVPTASFLRTRWPWRMPYANLRNHRKLLVIDGRVAFTGGMNIRHGHTLAEGCKNPVKDVQFRVEGPVVGSLLEVFAHDWTFATREVLQGLAWFPPLEPRGEVIARAIVDGPDDAFLALQWVLLGALACARRSVRIVTPYFLPEAEVASALGVAAKRGIEVEILLPEKNNLKLVRWASTDLLWQVLEPGCKVFLTKPPFDHSKLMVVDGAWSLIGSANWDPRSLRLNFELELECYDPALAAEIEAIIDAKRQDARELTLADVDGRPLPVRLRDGVTRLFAPYL